MRELYQLWSASLSAAEIDKIIDTAQRQTATGATVFASAAPLHHIRTSTIRWLPDDWVRNLLWGYVQKANAQAFNVDVDNHAEMQFTEYHAAEGGHYDWHHDVNWNGQSDFDRKLSVTVQLSDPADYAGGQFEFNDVTTNADFISKGTVLVFPSYLRHRVLPVTVGTRRSLVAWFFGPRWK